MTSPSSDYRTIPLTQGQVALVSAHRYEELNKFKWTAHWNKRLKKFYAVRGINLSGGRWGLVRMHRQILGLERGDKREGDHINHDTLDNRDENLRIATRSQNGCNRGAQINNKSGFKGVIWYKREGNWKAEIMIHRKHKHLGYFPTAELAYEAYCKAAKEIHGEFASVNI